jgi:hypothetical protein
VSPAATYADAVPTAVVPSQRLDLKQVLQRGLGYGVVLALVVLLPAFTASDLETRRHYLGLMAGLGSFGGPWLAAGVTFWARYHGDVQTVRDWRRNGGPALSALAPLLVRLSAALLVVAVAGWTIYLTT